MLLPLYPDAPDLAPARHRLTLFLVQYWGGPGTYSEERGHPRLRMRHAPFPIRTRVRDRWLVHMRAALGSVGAGLDPGLRNLARGDPRQIFIISERRWAEIVAPRR